MITFVLKWKDDQCNKGIRRFEVSPMPVVPDDRYTIVEEGMSFKAAWELREQLEEESCQE